MKIDVLREPVIQLALLGGLLGIGLMGCLALWISTSMQARQSRKAFQDFRLSMEKTIAELQVKVEELRVVPPAEPAPPAPMTVQGLNLTTRARALRMHRRGETISSISAALGVQQEEVELLLKMDRLLESSAV